MIDIWETGIHIGTECLRKYQQLKAYVDDAAEHGGNDERE